MSATYTKIAIVGAGGAVGKPTLDSLLAGGVAKVVVLSRPDSTNTFPSHANLTVEKVKYDDVNVVATTLKKHSVEVLVSTVGFGGLEGQTVLADAAKQAGVQLFVPSEFGFPTEGVTEGFLTLKAKVADYSKSIGLPVARVYTGLFAEYAPWVGSVQESGKFLLLNPGDKEFSLTALPDIGGFVAYAVTKLPPNKLQNATFRLEGDRFTLAGLANLFQELKSVSVERVDKFPEDIPGVQVKAYLVGQINVGKGSTSYDNVQGKELGPSANSNSLWEGHKWKTAREVLSAGQ
ncbi:NAD(P)-binding protein [Coniophora puteana RWD-64-598 SS2]|uniref:NAD(P)-binding protein n=1 Tax=Coniophora puteana (strain RWD-64-598) TaxID=741705 RepID=A0A5M3N2S0_CONPW|nr:NAD(P)-binding protein [Coniophora puteana RWD-64-598 SS2]EIW85577.1 NAD(P)-binding protein [Coniophora puteana RWD-64-598 SS2]